MSLTLSIVAVDKMGKMTESNMSIELEELRVKLGLEHLSSTGVNNNLLPYTKYSHHDNPGSSDVMVIAITSISENLSNGTINLDHLIKDGFQVVYFGSPKVKKGGRFGEKDNLIVLVRSSIACKSSLVPSPLKNYIYDNFEPFLKLRTSSRILIAPGSHSGVKTLENIFIPFNQTGIFSIRKTLAIKGLYTSGVSFKNTGDTVNYNPIVIVTNNSNNTIELLKGEELGEVALINNQSM